MNDQIPCGWIKSDLKKIQEELAQYRRHSGIAVSLLDYQELSRQYVELQKQCEIFRQDIQKYLSITADLQRRLNNAVDRNIELEHQIEAAPTVVCRMDGGKWACDEHLGFARATHKARLVRIEEIK